MLFTACGGHGDAGTPSPASPPARPTGTLSTAVTASTGTSATSAAGSASPTSKAPSITATSVATLAPTPAAATVQTVISGFAFSPLTVARGAAVTWANRDPTDHDVTAVDGTFASPPLHEGGTFSARFDRAGTYAYRCTLHPFMTASVIVQ